MSIEIARGDKAATSENVGVGYVARGSLRLCTTGGLSGISLGNPHTAFSSLPRYLLTLPVRYTWWQAASFSSLAEATSSHRWNYCEQGYNAEDRAQ